MFQFLVVYHRALTFKRALGTQYKKSRKSEHLVLRSLEEKVCAILLMICDEFVDGLSEYDGCDTESKAFVVRIEHDCSSMPDIVMSAHTMSKSLVSVRLRSSPAGTCYALIAVYGISIAKALIEPVNPSRHRRNTLRYPPLF